jgi:translation elongation factor EF-4
MVYGANKRQTIEQQIAQTYRQIARQLEIVGALRAQGYPTAGAERVLNYLNDVLERRKADRTRLQNSD